MFLAKLDFSRWTKDISFVRLPCLSAEILLDQGARRCSFMEFTWAYIQLKHPQTLEIHTQSSTLSPPVLHTQSITLSPPHSILRIFRPTIPSKQKPGFTMSRCPYCQYNNMAPAQKSVLFNKCSKCKKTFARNLPMQRHTYTPWWSRGNGTPVTTGSSGVTPPNVASVHTPPNDGSVHAPPKDDSVHGSKK